MTLRFLPITLEQRIDRRFEAVDRRFEALEARFSTFITIQLTTLLTIVAGLIGIIGTMLRR